MAKRAHPLSQAGGRVSGRNLLARWVLSAPNCIGPRLELDHVRGGASLPNPRVPGYVEADARLGRKVRETVELSLDGFHLLQDRHRESRDATSLREVWRSAYAPRRLDF